MARKIPEDAFEQYVAMGGERSYQALADVCGVTKRAITKLAAKDGWSTRLMKIERAVREKGDRKMVESIEEIRSRHLKTLKAMNARAISALQQFPLNSGMEAMRAAEMVIKLERLIVGEPSQRTELTVEEVTRREMHALLEVVGDDSDEEAGE